MATSRGASPADPTLAATTEDNSRGGLFVRSNVANPVSGVDVSGTAINNSEITVTLNYADGTSQSDSFTLNQSDAETLTFTVPGSSGGSGPSAGNVNVRSGVVNGTNLVLTLTDNTEVTIDVTSLTQNTQLTNAEVRTIVDGFPNIVRTVNGTAPDNAGNVTISGSGNTFTDSNTVDFSVDSVTNEVTAQAMVRVGNGTLTTTSLESADSIIVDPATGFQIVEVGTDSGVYRFQTIPVTPPPAPAEPPSFTAPAPTSALDPAPEEVIMFTAPTGNTVTGITNIQANDPDGTAIPGVTSDTDSITIPAGAANAPGDYDISATVTTMNDASGETRMTTEMPELVRYIPFFQSRAAITDVTASGVTASTTAFGGSFTAIAGTGRLYFAVESSLLASTVRRGIDGNTNFPFNVAFQNAITVTLADGTTRTFNHFVAPIRAGVNAGTFT